MEKQAAVVPSKGEGGGHFLQPTWGSGPWGAGSMSDRFAAVLPFIAGESVLDVGCASRYGKPDWIHGLLVKSFPHVVGIDNDRRIIESLREEGYAVTWGDAQDFDLSEQFDTVFAGELVEHLDNVHGFLSSVRRHLKPGGRLVLTTPNAFYVGGFVYRWGGRGQVHPQHTCWYCEDTLRHVLRANGYPAVEIFFAGHTSPTVLRRGATKLSRLIFPPQLALDTLIAVATAE